MPLSDEELLAELHRLAEELGHPPTLQELRNRGEYGASTYYTHFGSWREAMEAAGFESRDPQTEIHKDELLAELRELATELGETPSVTQMNEQGDYWVSTYRNHFGSWSDAIDAAGLPPHQQVERIPTEELIKEINRLADELGKQPSRDKMREHGAYDTDTYRRRFGSWSEALEEAGFESPPSPQEAELTKAELRDELQRLADELDKQPTMREMNEHGAYSPNTYVRHFGTWSTAIEETFS